MARTEYNIKADEPKTKSNPKLPTRKYFLRQVVLLLILGIPVRGRIQGPELKAVETILVAQPGLIPAMQLCLVNRPAEGDIHRLHHIIDNRHHEQVPDKSRSPGSVGTDTHNRCAVRTISCFLSLLPSAVSSHLHVAEKLKKKNRLYS